MIPQLRPALLHRVIETCGLEDCGELVAMTTPEQLAGVFDLDLWRPARPGSDDVFDASRFGLWLEVLLEGGEVAAAQKIAGLDAALVIAGLGQHVRVFDTAAVSPVTGEDLEDPPASSAQRAELTCELGGYLIAARRTEAWDAIVAVLGALDAAQADAFHRLMAGCRCLSNSEPEIDGLDDLLMEPEQAMFDLAVAREERREQQGFVAPAEARAFLAASREVRLDENAGPPESATARAYFRGMDEPMHPAPEPAASGSRAESSASAPASQAGPADAGARVDADAVVMAMLVEAGAAPQPTPALLGGHTQHEDSAGSPARMRSFMQAAYAHDPAAHLRRSRELAYLANALLAGCAVQERPLTPEEASDAAVAVCNLGLENWPRHWPPADAATDLVGVFQVGWTILHDEVCLRTAARLSQVIDGLWCSDREIQFGLVRLRREIWKHCQERAPWRAHGALDVLTLLDPPAWAALTALLAEFPVMHGAIGAARNARTLAISPTAFEWIAGNAQIAAIHGFLESLPDRLRS